MPSKKNHHNKHNYNKKPKPSVATTGAVSCGGVTASSSNRCFDDKPTTMCRAHSAPSSYLRLSIFHRSQDQVATTAAYHAWFYGRPRKQQLSTCPRLPLPALLPRDYPTHRILCGTQLTVSDLERAHLRRAMRLLVRARRRHRVANVVLAVMRCARRVQRAIRAAHARHVATQHLAVRHLWQVFPAAGNELLPFVAEYTYLVQVENYARGLVRESYEARSACPPSESTERKNMLSGDEIMSMIREKITNHNEGEDAEQAQDDDVIQLLSSEVVTFISEEQKTRDVLLDVSRCCAVVELIHGDGHSRRDNQEEEEDLEDLHEGKQSKKGTMMASCGTGMSSSDDDETNNKEVTPQKRDKAPPPPRLHQDDNPCAVSRSSLTLQRVAPRIDYAAFEQSLNSESHIVPAALSGDEVVWPPMSASNLHNAADYNVFMSDSSGDDDDDDVADAEVSPGATTNTTATTSHELAKAPASILKSSSASSSAQMASSKAVRFDPMSRHLRAGSNRSHHKMGACVLLEEEDDNNSSARNDTYDGAKWGASYASTIEEADSFMRGPPSPDTFTFHSTIVLGSMKKKTAANIANTSNSGVCVICELPDDGAEGLARCIGCRNVVHVECRTSRGYCVSACERMSALELGGHGGREDAIEKIIK
eukprot:PhM_4_TR9747/c0_g1_i1/m.88788